MPQFNELVTISRPEVSGYAWIVRSRGQVRVGEALLASNRETIPFTADGTLLGLLGLFSEISVSITDRGLRDVIPYFRQGNISGALIRLTNPTNFSLYILMDITITSVSITQQQGSDHNTIVKFGFTRNSITLSDALSVVLTGRVAIDFLEGWILTLDRKDITEGFSFDAWAEVLDIGASFNVRLSTSDDQISQETATLRVRYDNRIVSSLDVLLNGKTYRITDVTIEDRFRYMDLALSR